MNTTDLDSLIADQTKTMFLDFSPLPLHLTLGDFTGADETRVGTLAKADVESKGIDQALAQAEQKSVLVRFQTYSFVEGSTLIVRRYAWIPELRAILTDLEFSFFTR